jgi:hypothetical protein
VFKVQALRVIPVLGRLRQEECEMFKLSLGYNSERKEKKKTKKPPKDSGPSVHASSLEKNS